MNQVNYNHIKTWLPILVLVPLSGFSQSSFRGYVEDGKTGEPVPNASIFFNNTTIGTATQLSKHFRSMGRLK